MHRNNRTSDLARGIACSSLLRLTSTVLLLVVTPMLSATAQGDSRHMALAEALETFWTNSPELQLSRLDVREAEGLARRADAYPNPIAEAAWEPLFGGSDPGTEFSVGLSQTFEWPGMRKARRDALSSLIDVTRRRLHLDSMRLAVDVIRTYQRTLAHQARTGQLRALIDFFEQAEEWTGRQVREGESSGYALRRLRLERTLLQSRLAVDETEVLRMQRELARLLYPSGDVTRIIPADDSVAIPAVPGLDSLVRIAETTRAEIELARAEVDAARTELAFAQSERTPEPTVSLGFRHVSGEQNGPLLGLSLPLPIFDRNTGEIAATEVRITAAETRLNMSLLAVQADVRRAYEAYRAARERLEVLEYRFDADAEAMLHAARVGYREGEMTLAELLDAVEVYRELALTVIELRTEHRIAWSELMRATGRLLPTTGRESP